MRLGLSFLIRLALGFALPVLTSGALTWTNQKVDLVIKPEDKQLNGVFRFTNSGASSVTITDIKAACGCTTADLDKRTYAPGESGEIRAVYTVEKSKSTHQKMIVVTTDEADARPIELVLQITPNQEIAYAPRMLVWRIGDKLDPKLVTIASPDGRKITGIAIQSIAPEKAAIAQIEPSPSGGFTLSVRPASAFKSSQVAITCLATLDDGRTEPVTVHALVR